MIDLHTHSLLSDGALLPSELVRRADEMGLRAIAITDHVDFSNIDFVIPRLVKTCRILNKYWDIVSIPGAEITHVPLEEIGRLVSLARRLGARVVVGHGETISEPVLTGTNRAFINARVDILAHPGMITEECVKLAGALGVFLEITTRKAHMKPNRRLIKLALKNRADMVLDTDSHSHEDMITNDKRRAFLTKLGLTKRDTDKVIANAAHIFKKRS